MSPTPLDKRIDRLQSNLLTTGLQTRDNPTFQVLTQLIGVVKDIQNEFDSIIIPIPSPSGGSSSVTNSFAASLIGLENNLGDDNSSVSILAGRNNSSSGIPGGLPGYVQFNGGGYFAGDADFTFSTDTLTITKVLAPTSVSTPSLISTAAITVTPTAGNNLNVNLSTTGDFNVNSGQLYVDTSVGFVGIGSTGPLSPLFLSSAQNVDQASSFRMVSTHSTAVTAVFGCRFQVTANHATGTLGSVQALFVQGLYGGLSATSPAITNLYGAFFRTGIINASVAGTISNGYGAYIDSITNAGSGTPAVTFTSQVGLRIQSQGAGSGSGGLTITSAAAIVIVNQASATNNSNLVIGISTIQTGNWSIYNNSTYNNYFNGSIGIGPTTITALLHIKAGTATASTAPLKFTSGTNLTTAEAGAMEFNGTNLFFSPSTTRMTVWVGNDGAGAPATNLIGVIVDYYGTSATRVLTTPNSWGSVVIAGTTYKIPLYT